MKGEKVDPNSNGDLHEAFDLGPENPERANQWPSEDYVPGFKAAIGETWSVHFT